MKPSLVLLFLCPECWQCRSVSPCPVMHCWGCNSGLCAWQAPLYQRNSICSTTVTLLCWEDLCVGLECYPWSNKHGPGFSSAPLSNTEKTMRFKDLPAFHHCLVSLAQCTGCLQGEHKSLWGDSAVCTSHTHKTTPWEPSLCSSFTRLWHNSADKLRGNWVSRWGLSSRAAQSPRATIFQEHCCCVYTRTREYRDGGANEFMFYTKGKKKKGRKEKVPVTQTPQWHKQRRSWKTSKVYGKKPREDREDRICRLALKWTGNMKRCWERLGHSIKRWA